MPATVLRVERRIACIRSLKFIASGATALMVIVVLTGWKLENRALVGVFPGAIPMHPLSALMFAMATIALAIAGRTSPAARRTGLGLAIAVSIMGMIRLVALETGHAPAMNRLLFGEALQRMAVAWTPTRIHSTPNTAISFIFLGAALFIVHCRQIQYSLAAFLVTSITMVTAGLTIGGVFVNLVFGNVQATSVSMSASTAVAFVFITVGVLAEFFGRSHATAKTDSLEDSENPAPARTPRSTMLIAMGFGASIFVLAGIGIVSHNTIDQFRVDSLWSNHTYEVLSTISTLRADIKEAESQTRGYVITGDPAYVQASQVAIAAVEPRIESLRHLTADNPAQQRQLDYFVPIITKKIQILRQKQEKRAGGFDMAAEMPLITEGERLTGQIGLAIHGLEAEENELLVARVRAADLNFSRAVHLITAGAILGLVSVIAAAWMITIDIAGRAKTEAALRASDKMFRGLLESAPDAMVIVNETGGIEFFNEQAERAFGYTAEELGGQSIEKIIPNRHRTGRHGKRNSYFQVPLTPGTGARRNLFGIRKDGTAFPVEITLSPLRTPLGLRVSTAIRDVTRQKQEAETLRKLNSELKARTTQLEVTNKELESFSYSVSHDLRSPLRSIDGFSLALLEDNAGKLDAESQDHLHRVRAASQRMGQLIDDLINLARVTRVEMRREKVDLSRMARDIIEELQAASPDRKIQCRVADNLWAEADPALLRIVLSNLLGNAWKFTGANADAQIEFGYCDEEGNRGYFVGDNGAGFDMTYADKLFGAFQRLHSASDFPGTGIGLATVQRIVHRHGGRVWAEGAVEKGATFHFALAA